MTREQLQQELKSKIKLGVKPSDLKRTKVMPKSADNYTEKLEQEKADLLIKLANYEEEQKTSVKVFKDQTKLLGEKDKQLVSQEQLLIEKEVAITKLKIRIQELTQTKKKTNPYTTTVASDNENGASEEIINSNKFDANTQTEGITPNQLEDKLLEKRLENIHDFGTYQEILTKKEQLITSLEQQATLYQEKINRLKTQTNPPKNQALVLIVLLTITITLLLLK